MDRATPEQLKEAIMFAELCSHPDNDEGDFGTGATILLSEVRALQSELSQLKEGEHRNCVHRHELAKLKAELEKINSAPTNEWYLREDVLEVAKSDHNRAILFLNETQRKLIEAEARLASAEKAEYIANQIKAIMKIYREQETSEFGVDSPGGLEHMGDVWRRFKEWDDALKENANK